MDTLASELDTLVETGVIAGFSYAGTSTITGVILTTGGMRHDFTATAA